MNQSTIQPVNQQELKAADRKLFYAISIAMAVMFILMLIPMPFWLFAMLSGIGISFPVSVFLKNRKIEVIMPNKHA